jgi:DNA-binding transcriptional ArsR family regulator
MLTALADESGALYDPAQRIPAFCLPGVDTGTSVSEYLPFVTTNGTDTSAWDVLGDGSRREILTVLARTPLAVGELADRLPISRPAVSQHLRVLKEAGVVVDEERGTRRVYSVDAAALTALRDQLDTFWSRTLAGFTDLVNGSPTEQEETR